MSNWVIMVVRSGLRMTEAAITSVLAQTIPVKLLVVINGLQHNDAALALRNRRDIYLTTYADQRSLAYCWNRAIDWIFTQPDVTQVLVVNNDIELRPETYSVLSSRCEPYGNAAFVTAVGESNRALAFSTPINADESRPHPDFSCYMVPYATWIKVGSFDESFVGAYGEDAEIHVRMHKLGIRAISINLPFYHIASGTLKSMPESERIIIRQQADQNRAYFKRKWGCEIGSQEYYQLFKGEITNDNDKDNHNEQP